MQNIKSLVVVGNGTRLLAHMGNRLAALNATTGEVEEVLANDCNSVVYGPPGPDAGDNLLVARDRGVLVGNADLPELRTLLEWMPYSSAALVGQRLVLCHHFLGTYRRQLAVHERDGRELTVLAEGREEQPVWGLCALGRDAVAGVAPGWVAAWDLAPAGPRWRVELDVHFDSFLTADPTGAYVLVRSGDEQLHCLAGADGAPRWQYAPGDQLCAVLVRHERVLCLLANGEASCLDLATGRELARELLNPAGTENGALALDNELYVLHSDSSVVRYDVRDWLGDVGLPGATPAAGSFGALPTGLAAADLLQAVEAANWPAFRWEADAEPLLAVLHEAEQRLGVTAAHRVATDQLLALAQGSPAPFFKLIHSHGFRSQMESFALSRDGHYFAAGSWLFDADYDAGGDLQIWDVASGRVVNHIGPVEGGVGWPFNSNCLQWSPDGRLLGLSLNTNGTEAILPFADSYASQGYFYEPNGKDEPPVWCWHPEGKTLFVSCWQQGYDLQGVVVPLAAPGGGQRPSEYGFKAQPELYERFTAAELGLDENLDRKPQLPLRTFSRPQWLTSGEIGGFDGFQAYTLNPQTRTLSALVRNVRYPAGWSPDGRWLVQADGAELRVLDPAGQEQHQLSAGAALAGFATGPGSPPPSLTVEANPAPHQAPILRYDGVAVPHVHFLYWHPDPALPLLAAVSMGEEGGVVFYRDLELLGAVRTSIRYSNHLWLDELRAVVFAPDGRTAATLGRDNQVTVWALEPGNVHALRSFSVFEDNKGLMYGAEQRIIVAATQRLAFYDATTGEQVGHYELPDDDNRPELPTNSYLKGDYEEEEEEYYDGDERRRYFFPLTQDGETQWVGALPTGEVLADEAVLPQLDQELSFTIGNRLPWPYRWGTVRVLAELPEQAW